MLHGKKFERWSERVCMTNRGRKGKDTAVIAHVFDGESAKLVAAVRCSGERLGRPSGVSNAVE
jgi:hypothetical protein